MISENRKRTLLGIGLDNEDGQIRLTRGKNFQLVGGSHETHESMQEKCIKFNEKLDSCGKELDELEHRELQDLAGECDMKIQC